MFNEIIAAFLPIVPKPIVRKVSARYIAGSTLQDGMDTVRKLNAVGAMATVDVLGEYIRTPAEAEENTRYSCEVIGTLASQKLDGNLSIKLTSLGLSLDPALCEENVRRILNAGRENGNIFVRIDMENSPYTSVTLELYKKLRKEFSNVGAVLQAYLRRTSDDIQDLLSDGAATGMQTNIRLCKGIYREAPEIAFQERKEVQDNYLSCLEALLRGGAYVGIATHDDLLIAGGKTLVRQYNRDNSTFEFQMLLGVREEARDRTIREGYRLRVYVPFGADWYGYSLRRLKENPKMAGYIVKAMIGLG